MNEPAVQINTVLKSVVGSLPNPKPNSSDYNDWQKAKKAQELYFQAGVPQRYRPILSSTAPKYTAWKEKLAAISGELVGGKIIALIGKRGTGKTQLACELIRSSCCCGLSALYTTAMEIFIAVRETYNGEKNESAAINRYTRPALLVIDETQERGDTPWEDRLLTHIVDQRYANLKDTILISNLAPDAFAASMGASIISRLQETGGIVEFNWQSFRG